MVKPYDVIKWQNVQKLCINTLELPHTKSNEMISLVYLTYLNLFKDHVWCGIWASPLPTVTGQIDSHITQMKIDCSLLSNS